MINYVEEVKNAIQVVLELSDTSQISSETRLEHDLGFDSGLYIELLMLLEDRFPTIRLDPAALHREDFITVGRTAGFIARRLQWSIQESKE